MTKLCNGSMDTARKLIETLPNKNVYQRAIDVGFRVFLTCYYEELVELITDVLEESKRQLDERTAIKWPTVEQCVGAAYDYTSDIGGNDHDRLVFRDGFNTAVTTMRGDGDEDAD